MMAQSEIDSTNPTSAHPTDSHGRSIPLRVLVVHACRTDDVSKVKNAIELASLPGSRVSPHDVLSHAFKMAITKSADRVLAYVLAEGGRVPAYSHLPAGEGLPSQRILDLLIAHGWDINARRPSSEKPFLWQVVADHDLVAWALDHGASVQPKDQEPYTDNEPLRKHTDCPPLLEEAVLYGCHPSTFDLLRSKGAPLCRRILHFAVMKAAACGEAFVDRRLVLVRRLLDKYNLDVNASDHTVGNMGNHYGTPLCYVAYWDPACKDVVELLLERGADPELCAYPGGWSAVTLAEQQNNHRFLDVVATWRRISQ